MSIAVTSTSTNGLGDPTNFEGGANGVVAEQPAVSTSTTTSTSVSAAVTPRRGVGRGKARGKMSQSNSRHQQQLTSVSRCEECGLEFYIQPPFQPSSWLRIVYEALKKLHDEVTPHRKYFHYKHDICAYIDKNWQSICPDKKRTLTWNNTVSAVITTHRKLFKSNRKQSGYWTLRSQTPGAKGSESSDDEDDDEDDAEGSTNGRKPKKVNGSVGKVPRMKKRTYSEMVSVADTSPNPLPSVPQPTMNTMNTMTTMNGTIATAPNNSMGITPMTPNMDDDARAWQYQPRRRKTTTATAPTPPTPIVPVHVGSDSTADFVNSDASRRALPDSTMLNIAQPRVLAPATSTTIGMRTASTHNPALLHLNSTPHNSVQPSMLVSPQVLFPTDATLGSADDHTGHTNTHADTMWDEHWWDGATHHTDWDNPYTAID